MFPWPTESTVCSDRIRCVSGGLGPTARQHTGPAECDIEVALPPAVLQGQQLYLEIVRPYDLADAVVDNSDPEQPRFLN